MTVGLDARMAAYVAMLQRSGAVRSPLVERAFRTVRRDRCVAAFYDPATGTCVPVAQDGPVPEKLLDMIYADATLMTHFDADGQGHMSSSSQPRLMATMLEALDLRPGMQVLEIGAGTGYNAALLAVITGAEVVTVEASAEVAEEARRSFQRVGAEQVQVVQADGYFGHAAGAPYQRIVATVACAGVPAPWMDQLDAGGVILAPVAHAGVHPLLKVRRDADSAYGQSLQWCDFMRAIGRLYDWPADRYLCVESLPAMPRADHRVAPTLDLDTYWAWWFYLGIRDPRTTRVPVKGVNPNDGQCALVDPRLGMAFVLRDGRVSLDGDERLVHDVVRYRQEWEDLGRPAIPDWSCDLAPTGTERACLYAPSRWRLRARPLADLLEGSPSR